MTATATRDYFRATGADLREWSAEGDKLAEAEAARRKVNRAAKAASKAA
jgi:hypothetical protein